MKAYPLEVRERVIAAYDEGRTVSSLMAEFGMSRNAIDGLVKLRQETGSLAPRPHGGSAPRLLLPEHLPVLKQLRELDRNATQDVLAERLAILTGVWVSTITVGKALRKMGYRRKKGATPREKPPSCQSERPSPVRYRRPEKRSNQTTSGRKLYPSDLTDAEWELLKPLIPIAKSGGRHEVHPKREIVNAILYVLRSGCQWRMLPHDFPPQTTVYDYFRAWRDQGVWEQINHVLCKQARVRAGRKPQPTAGIVDSQSAKTTEKGGPEDMTGESA